MTTRTSAKLKRTLEALIHLYGAEQVKETLWRCEPYASESRQRVKEHNAIWKKQRARETMYLRSRESVLKYVDLYVLIHNHDWEDNFTVSVDQKATDGRSIWYLEPKSNLANFIEWLQSQGFIENDAFNQHGAQLLHFDHKERNEARQKAEEDRLAARTPLQVEIDEISSRWQRDLWNRMLG